MRPARDSANMSRLTARASQDRGFAAPMPDFSKIPNNQSARIRVEWDTRDTANSRLYSDMISMGPKIVTSDMLATHPTHGAEAYMPTASRNDTGVYTGASYFPDQLGVQNGRQERARLPGTIDSNPFLTSLEPSQIVREIRRSVIEDNRFYNDDTDARINERVFTHQLITAEDTRAIIERQVNAAERLRPVADDWLRPVDSNHTYGNRTQ